MYRFEKELKHIKNSEVLSFTEKVIARLPAPFWEKPASSTYKYHSPSSNVVGGLVEHTREVFWIAKTILDTHLFAGVNSDVILSACILHDGWKYKEGMHYTLRNHATVAAQEIERLMHESNFFLFSKPAWYQKVLNCIQSHNGTFTKEWQGEMSQEQIIVHLADMIGSRRFLSFIPGGVE